MTKKNDQNEAEGPIPADLYQILVCPVTKEPLKYSKDKKWLISSKSRRKYPIKNGIPILLPHSEK